MRPPLGRLRRKLTAWYIAVFALILFAFGGSVLVVLAHQRSLRLDRSLESAAEEMVRVRRAGAGVVIDPLEVLRIPGRDLFLFDRDGRLLHPGTAPEWVAASAREALRAGELWTDQETTDDRTLRIYARRFELSDGRSYAAVAVADAVELQDEYFAQILAFALAGAGALLLVALGGAVMARRSTEPVERAFGQMRRFMADAAHELRTPLTVLRGRAEVALQRARSADEYAAALAGIAAETERMSSLIDKMLLLSQADAGELRLRRESIFLDDLLVEAAEDARVLAAARGVNVEIRDLDESPIHADPHLVRQLLLNILANAIQFTPEGGRVVASAVWEGEASVVTIADSGAGIPAELLPHVFEPFVRADPARGRAGGSGLGLAIARSIAAAHGATVQLESEVGRGTRVRIAFPAV
jgi:signal transduction histidine kinase